MLRLDTKSIVAVVLAAKWQEYYNDALTAEEEKAITEELERVKLLLPHVESLDLDRQYEAELTSFIAGYKQGIELALSLTAPNVTDLDETARALAEVDADFKSNNANAH